MEPEHRHQLQQNDLQAFLQNFRAWWSRNGWTTVLTVLLVVVVAGGTFYVRNRSTWRRQAAYSDLQAAVLQPKTRGRKNPPPTFKSVANEYSDLPKVRARALLRAGEQWRNQALAGGNSGKVSGSNDSSGGSDGEEQSAQYALEKAADAYRTIIGMNQAPKIMVLNARLGLAAVHESRGKFQKAKEQYDKILGAAGDYKAIAKKANQRKADLQELKSPVRFVKAPKEKKKDKKSDKAQKEGASGEEKGKGASGDQGKTETGGKKQQADTSGGDGSKGSSGKKKTSDAKETSSGEADGGSS